MKAVRATLQSFCLKIFQFLASSPEFCIILLVYVVLFGTNGAHNRGGSWVVRGCNLENDFGASGWIPNETEVSVCILH